MSLDALLDISYNISTMFNLDFLIPQFMDTISVIWRDMD